MKYKPRRYKFKLTRREANLAGLESREFSANTWKIGKEMLDIEAKIQENKDHLDGKNGPLFSHEVREYTRSQRQEQVKLWVVSTAIDMLIEHELPELLRTPVVPPSPFSDDKASRFRQ